MTRRELLRSALACGEFRLVVALAVAAVTAAVAWASPTTVPAGVPVGLVTWPDPDDIPKSATAPPLDGDPDGGKTI